MRTARVIPFPAPILLPRVCEADSADIDRPLPTTEGRLAFFIDADRPCLVLDY